MRDERHLTIDIPLVLRRRGGRKLVVAPSGLGLTESATPRLDNALITSLARAFRWKAMLESGRYATMDDLARAENVTRPYISQIVRLAYLAPDIVEAILDGRQPSQAKLPQVLPNDWEEQRTLLVFWLQISDDRKGAETGCRLTTMDLGKRT